MPTQTTLRRPGPLDALLGAWAFEITQEASRSCGPVGVRPGGRRCLSPAACYRRFLADHARRVARELTIPDRDRDGNRYWERSEDGESWQRDFDIRYTKARPHA
jgi:hypothetical protein